METTKSKLKGAQKHCENTLLTLQTKPDQLNIPSMINPELADNDMLLLSKELDNNTKKLPSQQNYYTIMHLKHETLSWHPTILTRAIRPQTKLQ